MTLADAPLDTPLIITSTQLDDAIAHHLGVLGIDSARTVTLTRRAGGRGPIIVVAGTTHATIGHDIAAAVDVRVS